MSTESVDRDSKVAWTEKESTAATPYVPFAASDSSFPSPCVPGGVVDRWPFSRAFSIMSSIGSLLTAVLQHQVTPHSPSSPRVQESGLRNENQARKMAASFCRFFQRKSGMFVVFLFFCQSIVNRCVCHDKRCNLDDRQYVQMHCAKEGRLALECRGYTSKLLQSSAKVCHPGQHSCRHVYGWAHVPLHSRISTAMHTERLCRTCFYTHQAEKRQVGAQQDVAITCASFATCPFLVLWNPWLNTLRRCCSNGLDSAIRWGVQATKNNYQFAQHTQRSNAPRRERFSWKCAAPEAQHMQRRAKNELRNMRGRTEASQRFLPHATIVSAKGQAKLFSSSSRI